MRHWQLAILGVILLVQVADAAYGVKWTPGDTNAVAGAYLVAENAFEMKMRQPDGRIRVFHRDFAQPNLLYGEAPWVGEDLGNGMFKILTNPEFKGGRTGYVFLNGHLRRMILGRKDYNFEQMPYPASTNSLEELWPKELTGEEARKLWGTWTNDDGRWRFGYENPNKAGCLCAELALMFLSLLFLARNRRWLQAIGILGTLVAFVLLVKTESRSALIALIAGMDVMFAFKIRTYFTWKRFAAVCCALIACLAIIVFCGVGERFSTKIVDVTSESDSFRLNVWRAAPQMIADAPCGWGLGVAGKAYTSWYQPPTEFKVVRTLVNSHLTWLVELGWIGGFAYLSMLFFMLGFLLWQGKKKGNLLPAALLTVLIVAGLFNSVMEAPTLWLVPIASMMTLFPGRSSAIGFRHLRNIAFVSVGCALVVMATLLIVGSANRKGPWLRASKGRVIVNGSSANTWVVDDGAVLGRGFIGKELRLYYASFPQDLPLGVVWNIDDLPGNCKHVALAGKRCKDFLARAEKDPSFVARFASITFVSPPFAASEIPSAMHIRVIQGELALRRLPASTPAPTNLTMVPGAELYLPGWMRMLLAQEKKLNPPPKTPPVEGEEK